MQNNRSPTYLYIILNILSFPGYSKLIFRLTSLLSFSSHFITVGGGHHPHDVPHHPMVFTAYSWLCSRIITGNDKRTIYSTKHQIKVDCMTNTVTMAVSLLHYNFCLMYQYAVWSTILYMAFWKVSCYIPNLSNLWMKLQRDYLLIFFVWISV